MGIIMKSVLIVDLNKNIFFFKYNFICIMYLYIIIKYGRYENNDIDIIIITQFNS